MTFEFFRENCNFLLHVYIMEKLIYPTSTVTAIVKIQLINFNFTHWSVTEKIHDDFVCVYKM